MSTPFRNPADPRLQRELARRKAERERVRRDMQALSGRARDAGLTQIAHVLDLAEAMDPDAVWPAEGPLKRPDGGG